MKVELTNRRSVQATSPWLENVTVTEYAVTVVTTFGRVSVARTRHGLEVAGYLTKPDEGFIETYNGLDAAVTRDFENGHRTFRLRPFGSVPMSEMNEDSTLREKCVQWMRKPKS